jgi:hypothetical protein
MLASKKLTALELTSMRANLPKELDMNVSFMTKADILSADLLIDKKFIDFLDSKKVIERALQSGKRRRETPISFAKYLDDVYNHKKRSKDEKLVDETSHKPSSRSNVK